MNAIDAWLYFNGPEPEHIRPLLDILRDLPPSTPEDKQRRVRQISERLDAEIARKEKPSVATAAAIARAPGEPQVNDRAELSAHGATARSPSFDDRPATPLPAKPPSPPVDAQEAYASLLAELSIWPERSAEILPRCCLSHYCRALRLCSGVTEGGPFLIQSGSVKKREERAESGKELEPS